MSEGAAREQLTQGVADPTSLGAEVVRTTPRGWAVLLLFRMQESSAALTSLAFGVFLPFIRKDLTLSPVEIGALQAVNWVASVILGVVAAGTLSHFRPISLIFVLSLLSIPFVAAQGLAVSFVTLFAARLVFSGFRAAEAPGRTLLLQQWVARRDYAAVNAVALSLHSVLLAATFSTVALIIGLVGSWRIAFYILAGLMLAQLFAWRLLALETKAPVQNIECALKARAPNPFWALRSYPQVWTLGVVGFGLGAIWAGMVTFVPTLLLDQRGIALFGPVVAFLYFGLIPTAPFAGWIARKVPNRKVLLSVTALLNSVLGVAITLTGNQALLMLFLFDLGAVWSPFPAIQVLPFEFQGIRPREVAVVSATMFTFTGLGFAFGPVITGFATQVSGSLVTGLLVLCAVSAVGIVAGMFYPAHSGKRAASLAADLPSA